MLPKRTPMKRTLAIALLGLLASSRAWAQATLEQDIIKLEQTVTDAQFKKDRAALERLLADDYLYTHSNGSVLNKAQEIAESMSSDVQWTDSKFADLKVRIFGDVAVLTGEQTIQGTAKGYVPGPRRITDIFVRRSGRWQWLGGQATLEPTK
ncbi:MAG: nuclear transport factor 2 family protein [Candidatus Eisenbacteria bacterium]|uniref:Nuclear transport factor 2 family protein n=1 Tax=Eiseniibacteriota bacterium TaxID=2212470 RepID=A0A538S7C9_UNCEI|nr:MAG: nuclear transport factor 2 family protein [Candidatus Eisenbacteria bacterium]